MKKILMTLVFVLMTALSLSAKCDWSTLKLQQWNQRNDYKWYVSGQVLDDTCVDYMFMVYDFQTKKIDTLESFRGICEVQFNVKGKYKMYLKVWNKCEKCDTALYREVNIIYFPNCKFIYDLKSTDGVCKDSMVGEMTLGPWTKGDTCWEWYSYIWNGPLLDSLSALDFQHMTDNDLWSYYDFNDSDLVHYDGPENSARIIKYKFPHEGNYLVATQWYNKCLDQDTFFFTKITFEECNTTKTKPIIVSAIGIKVFPNPADDKVIFTVSGTGKILTNTYEVYDSKGKLITSGKMGGSICIGTYDLPDGVYVVKIGKLTQKFIVKH
jgi:hypothetical protein